MNWESLSKEAKQKVLLGVMVLAGVLYVVFNFLVGPSMEGWKKTKADLGEVESKLQLAEAAINARAKTYDSLSEAAISLREDSAKYIPPSENPLLWVAERVSLHARKVGVAIESVAPTGSSSAPWLRRADIPRSFMPYSVRIVTRCGYNKLVELVESFETSNPYICVQGVTINTRADSLDSHRITMSLEWPMWIDPKGPANIKEPDRNENA